VSEVPGVKRIAATVAVGATVEECMNLLCSPIKHKVSDTSLLISSLCMKVELDKHACVMLPDLKAG
jgi:hypothetical protein